MIIRKSIVIFFVLVFFTNIFFSSLRLPIFIPKALLSFRDLLIIFLALLGPFLVYRRASWSIFYLYFLLLISYVLLVFQIIFIPDVAPVGNVVSLSRIVLAMPIISVIVCLVMTSDDIDYVSTKIDVFFFSFLVLCLIESVFLVAGYYGLYIDAIGFKQYMASKGTSSSYAFGFFGYRIITPFFNASVGGVFLSFIFYYYFKNKKYFLSILTVLPLIFTVSKTGFLLLFIFLIFRSKCYLGFLAASLVYLGLAFIVPLLDASSISPENYQLFHIASIKHHMFGLISGLEYAFEPRGFGGAGTVPNIDNLNIELVGRESGFGAGVGSIGFFYPILLFISMATMCYRFGVNSLSFFSAYLLIALMNEGASVFYLWLPIFFIFISENKCKVVKG